MATTLTVLAFWLGSACASCHLSGAIGSGWGPGQWRNNATNITAQAIYDRVQTPGATSSVTFNFTAFPGVLEQWTWRVNVTNVGVGDLPGGYARSAADSFGELENLHFVNVAYDFQWPEGGKFQDAQNRTFSKNGVRTSLGPGKLYTERAAMAIVLVGVFGEDCVAAMLNASAQRSIPNGDSCGLPFQGFTAIPQCQSIFNTTKYPGRSCGAYDGGQLGNIT